MLAEFLPVALFWLGTCSSSSYELVLSVPPDTGGPRTLSAIRFVYDVAGVEGAECWVMWLVFSVFGNAIMVPATVTVRALGRAAARRR